MCVEEHTQYLEKVIIWAKVVENHAIFPFVIDGNLNSNNF